MGNIDRAFDETAATKMGLLTRADVVSAGGTDDIVRWRRDSRLWQRLQKGVYLTGSAPPTWRQQLLAATLGAGASAVASHRAAALVWALDGFRTAPLELTVPITCEPLPSDVILHRTRRLDPRDHTVRDGQPVTVVERTLLDLARDRSWRTVEMALESAIRRGLTTEAKTRRFLDEGSRRGRKGVRKLRALLDERAGERAAGSAAEVEFLRLVRQAGLPKPVRQHLLSLRDGTVAAVDFAWPRHRFAVEVDGFEAHDGRQSFYRDRARDNGIRDTGWGLRRVTSDEVRRRPEAIVAALQRKLCGFSRPSAQQTRTVA